MRDSEDSVDCGKPTAEGYLGTGSIALAVGFAENAGFVGWRPFVEGMAHMEHAELRSLGQFVLHMIVVVNKSNLTGLQDAAPW